MPKLIIQEKAYAKLRCYVTGVDIEISGLGKSHKNEEGDIVVEDFNILKQECTVGSTNIEQDALAKFTYNLMKANEPTEAWNVWWHSHANGGVFWSGTDDKTIEEHAGGGSHLISLVTNIADDHKARLDIFPKDMSGYNQKIFYKIDLDVEIEESKKMQNKRKEFEEIIEGAEQEKKDTIKIFDEVIVDAKKSLLDIPNLVLISKKDQEDITKEIKELVSQPRLLTRFINNKSNHCLPLYYKDYKNQCYKHHRDRKSKWEYWMEEDKEYPSQIKLELAPEEYDDMTKEEYEALRQKNDIIINGFLPRDNEITEKELVEIYNDEYLSKY